jgi:UDP-N-acetyl-D-mannosaminuronic acid dehydrogenase
MYTFTMSISHSTLIVGGGFVGLTLAAKFSKSLNCNIGILESNPDRVADLLVGQTYIFEPNLDEIIRKAVSSGVMQVFSALSNLMYDSVFICVGTRQLSKDPKSMSRLVDICLSVSKQIKTNGALFIRSTVKVGTTRIVSAELKKNHRQDIKVFFAPERTAEGVALSELDELPQILASESMESINSGELMLQNLGFSVIKASKLEVAEFAKLVANAWRDSIFGISNEIALAAGALNLSVSETLHLINFNYPRAKIPRPGPVGGPCLSKDTHILLDSLPEDFMESSVLLKSRSLNESLDKTAANMISSYLETRNNSSTILVAGLAFKGTPRTNDIRNSFAVGVINEILGKHPNLTLRIWDPSLTDRDFGEFKEFRLYEIEDYSPNVILLGNNGAAIYSEDFVSFLSRNINNPFVVDFWGVYKSLSLPRKNGYFLGEPLN